MLKNYGVFFIREELDEDAFLENCDGELIRTSCTFYTTYVLTKNYHERNIIRCFNLKNNITVQDVIFII